MSKKTYKYDFSGKLEYAFRKMHLWVILSPKLKCNRKVNQRYL